MLQCLTPWNLLWNLFHAHQCVDIYSSTDLNGAYGFFDYVPFFFKTYALELPIYYLFLRKTRDFLQILNADLVLNLATHPIVFFIIPMVLAVFQATYMQYLFIAEIFAPVTEALILYYFFKLSLRRAFAAAILANLFSWSVGIFWI
jgi:hypothetical protein